MSESPPAPTPAPAPAAGLPLAADADLATALERALPAPVRILARRPSPYASSFRLEQLDVEDGNGARRALVWKDLSPSALLPGARRARDGAPPDPARELRAYALLDGAGLGTPHRVAAVEEPDRTWLFLEAVAGARLEHVGDPAAWQAVARWLARAHVDLTARADALAAPAARTTPTDRLATPADAHAAQANRFATPADAHAAQANRSATPADARTTPADRLATPAAAHAGRADALAAPAWPPPWTFPDPAALLARAAAERGGPPQRLRRVEALAAPLEAAVARLAAAAPPSVIHGELYAANVLIADDGRVCALDWETIARGPALLDLAALTAGAWEDPREALAEVYREALPDPPPAAQLRAELDAARLLTAAQWLAAPAGWSPPPEQARDWLADAELVADRVART